MIDVRAIMDVLPHRPPFLLVDRIIEYEPGRRIVGVKNVSINEPFFAGHFPGHPVMPGVLIVEAMAQAGAFLALKEVGGDGRLAYMAAIDHCRFRRPVRPGDRLVLEVTTVARKGAVWKMRGEARVDGQLAASGVLMAAMAEAESSPGVPGADR